MFMSAWFMLVDPEGELETDPNGVVLRSTDPQCDSYVFGAEPVNVTMQMDIEKFRALPHLFVEMVPDEGGGGVPIAEAAEAAEAVDGDEVDAEVNDSDEDPGDEAPGEASGDSDTSDEEESDEGEFDPETAIIAMLEAGKPLSKKSLKDLLPAEMADQADEIYDNFIEKHGNELKKFGHNLFLKKHHTE
jgi:hypothetical protein